MKLYGEAQKEGVVDGKKFSKEFQAEYRKPYLISNCLSCGSTFKDCCAGYWGNGKRGQLRGFYSEPSTPGYCSHFCALDAGLVSQIPPVISSIT
ncbi:hypothetical protein ATANTOWER_023515 [Ataeniobius toweri]|uniref:CxC7-like cysteine cluster associated with KDZ transposases domain-containing protein n=1 Tax=Ataeniobius toweri TaxID=208326 RepID=A0ABU7C0M8_9TELE|nr:hypothetical protein [Ataeniobius toweri]